MTPGVAVGHFVIFFFLRHVPRGLRVAASIDEITPVLTARQVIEHSEYSRGSRGLGIRETSRESWMLNTLNIEY